MLAVGALAAVGFRIGQTLTGFGAGTLLVLAF